MRKLLPFFIIGLAVIIAYGQLLNMYFWHDDYTTLYILQRGYLMWFPYQITSFLTKIFLPVFGLEPRGFYFIAILLYLTASFLLYFFLKMLIKDSTFSLLATLIFAGGYVGQDEMKMFLGTGFGSILAINTLLGSLIAFLHFKATNSTKTLLISFTLLFFTIEVASHRMATAGLLLIAADWLLPSPRTKSQLQAKLLRSAVILALTTIYFIFKPTQFILDYPLRNPLVNQPTPSQINNIPQFSFGLTNHVKAIGSFWNVVFPFEYYYQLFHFTKNTLRINPIWTSALPAATIILPYFLVARSKLKKYSLPLVVFSFFWAGLASKLVSDPDELFPMINGGLFLAFMGIIFLAKLPLYPQTALFASLSPFLVLATFYLVGDNYVLNSYHRYLLVGAFTAPLVFGSVFLTKDKSLRKVSLIIISLITGSHLYAGFTTQNEFVNSRSIHARKVFLQMKSYLPQITEKTTIYIKTTDFSLRHSVGDALRVGALPSEAAIAVHYQTTIDNIISIEDLDPTKELPNLQTFLYNGETLTKED